MKSIRGLLLCIIVVAVLFASALSAYAIGFEAERAYESVFVIYSGSSLGSGFAVGPNCIVTNAHVIGDVGNITVATYEGTEYNAFVLGMDEWLDIAVLMVKDVQFTYLEIADMSQMKTGDDIYAIGAPKGMAYTLTKGSISAKERLVGEQTYIQIDAAINEGNSGGPLMNDAGQVLGMNTLKMLDSEGIGLAIPISRVCQYLQSLGIGLDEKGNVTDSVAEPAQPAATEPTYEKKTSRRKTTSTSAGNHLAFGIAALSLAGNAILAALLMNEKKKNAAPQYDPRERTDFDIDILE